MLANLGHFVFFSGTLVVFAAMGITLHFGAELPAAHTWAVPQRAPNIRVLANDGRLITNRGQTGGEAIGYSELPWYVPAAFISAEDRRFAQHIGVDPIGLLAVMVESIEAGLVTRGASTITQQVAKNLFLTPEQTLGRKVQEAILALWLERHYSKDDILEIYMNRVYFGAGAIGIEAAAQTYFGISARDLTLGQAAMLVGLLPAPSAYNPKANWDAALARQRQTLNAMVRDGKITLQEAQAVSVDSGVSSTSREKGAEFYVADWVEDLMSAYLGEVVEDVVVFTSIDLDLQREAENTLRNAIATEGNRRNFSQGALVTMNTNGRVLAMVGGIDYGSSQFNRAVTARRQPGSTFKPFVYAAAMEKGYTPETIADDTRFEFEGWSPRNDPDRYRGPVSLREALTHSLNTVTSRLVIDLTPDTVIELAMRLGIGSPMPRVPSIGLGTAELSLLELTSAYVPFANGGIGVIPNVIERIETKDGKLLYEASDAGPGRVLTPMVVAEINDMLQNAVMVGTGHRATVDGWQIAGKTGTSQNSRDALFLGYSAELVTGIWLGRDDDKPTTLYGGNVPADVWSSYMTKALAEMTPTPLPNYAQAQLAQ